MYSDGDTPKGWVAPFGHPRIKACSRLPMAFRSVPRPSSPPGAKASTECPYRAPCARQHSPRGQRGTPPCTGTIVDGATQSSALSRQSSEKTGSQGRHPARPARIGRCTAIFALLSTYTNASEHCRIVGLDDPWPHPHRQQPRSLPVRQATQRYDGPALPQSKPTPPRQPNHNRVVLRAQKRTRTRFTTQKNRHRQALTQRQTRHAAPPHALGGRHRHTDRGTIP